MKRTISFFIFISVFSFMFLNAPWTETFGSFNYVVKVLNFFTYTLFYTS